MKIFAAIILMLSLTACVDTPTHSTQVVDDRPRVAFEPVNLQKDLTEYEVIIDGIGYGSLDQYLANRNTLPIVAGRHLIEVRKNGKVVSSQDVVLGEHTTRVIKVVEK